MARNLYDLGDRTPDQNSDWLNDRSETRSRIVPLGMVVVALAMAGAALLLFRDALPQSVGGARRADTATTISETFTQCDDLAGQACVLTPDSYAYAGKRYHLSDISVPSLNDPSCETEAQRARAGRAALTAMMNGGTLQALPDGANNDRSARLLVRDNVSLGQLMILKGHAKPWTRDMIDWCSA